MNDKDKIKIANKIIRKIRGNKIKSFDDNTLEAELIKENYEDVLKRLLSKNPWSFALKREEATRLKNNYNNEYSYAYQTPLNMLRLNAVYSLGSTKAVPEQLWDVIAPEGNKIIITDIDRIKIEYVKRIDEWQMPDSFQDLLVHAVAAEIILAFSQDRQLYNTLKEDAYGLPSELGSGGKFRIAANEDATQKPPEKIGSSPLIRARFGGANS